MKKIAFLLAVLAMGTSSRTMNEAAASTQDPRALTKEKLKNAQCGIAQLQARMGYTWFQNFEKGFEIITQALNSPYKLNHSQSQALTDLKTALLNATPVNFRPALEASATSRGFTKALEQERFKKAIYFAHTCIHAGLLQRLAHPSAILENIDLVMQATQANYQAFEKITEEELRPAQATRQMHAKRTLEMRREEQEADKKRQAKRRNVDPRQPTLDAFFKPASR